MKSSKAQLASASAREKKPEEVRKRVMRNAARREALKAGLVHKGDGKEIDHIVPLDRGGTNAKSNLRIVDRSENRGWRKGKKGKESFEA